MKAKMLMVVVLAALIGFSGSANASLSYECNRYVGGDYKGFIKVVADNKAEAEAKAFEKWKEELKLPVDSVQCK